MPFLVGRSSGSAAQPATPCATPDCERRAVPTSDRCRLHLTEDLRADGADIPFDDPEMAAMWGFAIHLTRRIVADLPDAVLQAGAPYETLEMFAVVDPNATWQFVFLMTDLLGTHLTDERPFMGMTRPGVVQLDTGDLLLRLQMGVATSAVDAILPRFESACRTIVFEFVEPADIRFVGVHRGVIADDD